MGFGSTHMKFEIIDPADDSRWDALLLRSEDHSFFHSSAWAKVLKQSYRFKPVYFSSFAGDRLAFLMPFMEVSSFITGTRGVSLPFTDQCPPFAPETGFLQEAVHEGIAFGKEAGWRSLEWRDSQYLGEEAIPSEEHYTHDILLARDEQKIFAAFADSNRRCIRKALKEGVSVDISHSLDSVKTFYRLNCRTRKRHGLPPQPFLFFENLHRHVISDGKGIVATARHAGKVVASAVFLHFGKRAIYKYGASDSAHQHLRPNNLIMWEAIRWYGERGFETLNLGRTERDHLGLLQYKRGWGAVESPLRYFKYCLKREMFTAEKRKKHELIKKAVARIPVALLRGAGRILYKHVG